MTLPGGAGVSGYVIERVLGVGGMGTVYLARHPVLPRRDALKVLSAELSADPAFRARFQREADLAAALDHPNIVRVYTRGETEAGQLWIAMQFVDGADAGVALKAGPMNAPRAAHVAGQVARALDYAHARGVLHRDIKPANFLLSGPHGDRERVLLADFGIARALDDATNLTATGAMVATVAYAAPEAIEGGRTDHRADIYSLGCALYRMLTNKTPYGDAGTISAVMMAHVMKPPPIVSAAAPWLPRDIDDVVAKAMAKDPAARYQNARELASDAAAALGRAESTAAVPWWPEPSPHPGAERHSALAPQPAQSHRGWAPTSLAGQPAQPVEPGSPPLANRRRRRRTVAWIAAAVAAVLVAGTAVAIVVTRRPAPAPYQAQTFTHTFGTTTIAQRPSAVAALSLSDADVVLSLGVQPVVIATGGGPKLPSWLTSLVHGTPKVLGDVDPAAVKSAGPDVLVDTEADQQTYAALAAVGPTITRPVDPDTSWSNAAQISWIARILGAERAAASLNDKAVAHRVTILQQHPEFTGKTVVVLGFSPSGWSAQLPGSPVANYLTNLGLTYSKKFPASPDGRTETAVREFDLLDVGADVTVIVRTDKAAGGGGFGGLPTALTENGSKVMVVDDADEVAALATVGPAASEYLDTSLVPSLSNELR